MIQDTLLQKLEFMWGLPIFYVMMPDIYADALPFSPGGNLWNRAEKRNDGRR